MPATHARGTERMDAVAAIEDALRCLVDAWNRGDAEEFAACFTRGAEYTTGAGQTVRGRAHIAALVAGRTKVAVVEQPLVACDGLAAQGRFDWATAATQGSAPRRGTITCALVRHGDRWLIEELHNEEAGG